MHILFCLAHLLSIFDFQHTFSFRTKAKAPHHGMHRNQMQVDLLSVDL